MQSQIVKLIRKSVAVNPNILLNDFESLSLSFFWEGEFFLKLTYHLVIYSMSISLVFKLMAIYRVTSWMPLNQIRWKYYLSQKVRQESG